MSDRISQYWQSLLSRREFGKVTIGSMAAASLPLRPQTAEPAGGTAKKVVKNINMLFRKPELTHEEFLKHWVEVHAPIANNIPQILRYVICPVIPQPNRPNDPGVDGVAEVWFGSWEDSQSFGTSPEAKKWGADGKTFISHSMAVMAEEIVIIAGSNSALR